MLKHAGSYYWNYVQRADSKQLNEDLFKHGDQVRLHRAPDLTGLHQVSMSSVRTGTQVELWHKFGDTVAEAKWQGENVAFQSIDDADLSSRAKAIKRLFKTKSGAADLLPNRLIRGFADETAMRTEFATESAIVAERLGTRPAPAQQGPPTEIALGGHKIRLWRHTEDGEAHPVQRLLFASKAALEADNVLPANYAKFEAGVPVDITLVVTNPTHAKASITNWGDLAAWHVGASDAYTAETIFCFDRVAGLAPETAPLAAATCKCFRNERPLTVDDVLQHVDDQDKEGALWYNVATEVSWPCAGGGRGCDFPAAAAQDVAIKAGFDGMFYFLNVDRTHRLYDMTLTFEDTANAVSGQNFMFRNGQMFRNPDTWQLKENTGSVVQTSDAMSFVRAGTRRLRVELDSQKLVLRLPLEANPKFPAMKCGNDQDCQPRRLPVSLGTFTVDLALVDYGHSRTKVTTETYLSQSFDLLRDSDDIATNHVGPSEQQDRRSAAVAAGRLLHAKSHYLKLILVASAGKGDINGMPQLIKALEDMGSIVTPGDFTKMLLDNSVSKDHLQRDYDAGKIGLTTNHEGERYPLIFPFFEFKEDQIAIRVPCEYFAGTAEEVTFVTRETLAQQQQNCQDVLNTMKIFADTARTSMQRDDNYDTAKKMVDWMADMGQQMTAMYVGLQEQEVQVDDEGACYMDDTTDTMLLFGGVVEGRDTANQLEAAFDTTTAAVGGWLGSYINTALKAGICGVGISSAVFSFGGSVPIAVVSCIPFVKQVSKMLVDTIQKAWEKTARVDQPTFVGQLAWAQQYYDRLSQVMEGLAKSGHRPSELTTNTIEAFKCTLEKMNSYSKVLKTDEGHQQQTVARTKGEDEAKAKLEEVTTMIGLVTQAEHVVLSTAEFQKLGSNQNKMMLAQTEAKEARAKQLQLLNGNKDALAQLQRAQTGIKEETTATLASLKAGLVTLKNDLVKKISDTAAHLADASAQEHEAALAALTQAVEKINAKATELTNEVTDGQTTLTTRLETLQASVTQVHDVNVKMIGNTRDIQSTIEGAIDQARIPVHRSRLGGLFGR